MQIYNAAYAVIAGPRHPRGVGQPTRERWPEVWRFNAPIYDAVLRGESRSFDDQMLTIERYGAPEDAWFDLAYCALRNDAGLISGVLVTVVETTRQVLAERQIAGQRERQRRLFEQAPGFICILTGPDHMYEFGNEAYVRLIGRDDFVGKTVREAMSDIAGQGFYELLDEVYATSPTMCRCACRARRRRRSRSTTSISSTRPSSTRSAASPASSRKAMM